MAGGAAQFRPRLLRCVRNDTVFGGISEAVMTVLSVIGDTPRRREDARFTTGHGSYLDDLRFDRLAHAVVLRSPHAHALIQRVDTTAARAMAGVLVVLTNEDARADGLQPMRPTADTNVQTGEKLVF